MEPYRIIVVDDEDDIRSRIAGLVETRPDFSVVGEAANGFDALELAQKVNPHILITDIRMPFIDGLELMRQVRRDAPGVRFIVVSGFDEFDYAREAIKLGVSAYLTKPIKPTELFDVLDKVVKDLEGEELSQSEAEQLQKLYQKSVPLLIEQYINELLSGSTSHGQEALLAHNISFDTPYVVVSLRMRNQGLHSFSQQSEKSKLLVRDRVDSILKSADIDFVSTNTQNLLVYIIYIEGEKTAAESLSDSLALAVKLSAKFAHTDIAIGVSHPHIGASQLAEAFSQSEQALNAEAFVEADGVIYYDDLKTTRGATPSQGLSREEVHALDHVIRTGSASDIQEAFAQLKKRSRQIDCRVMAFHMGHVLFSFANALDIPIYTAIDGDPTIYLLNFIDMDAMLNWVEQMVIKLKSYGEAQKVSHVQEIVDGALEYIRANYQNSYLALEEVADSQGVSVSYLSTLLKRRGTSFLKYLTDIRIAHAKELLSLTGYRMIQIAELCGYNDAYYFSHSFKKYEGVSPRVYREQLSEK